MSVQINCHLHEAPIDSCRVLFAERMSDGNPTVCFEIHAVNIYFRTSQQIQQTIEALNVAKERMSEMEDIDTQADIERAGHALDIGYPEPL